MTQPAPEVAHLISADEITSLIPGISDEWADVYEAVIDATIGELTAGGGMVIAARVPLIRHVVLVALQRAGQARPWLESETIGPYAARYRDVQAALFLPWELSRLRELLGMEAKRAAHGGARGNFPAPGDYDPLFARPADVRWVRLSPGAEHLLDSLLDPPSDLVDTDYSAIATGAQGAPAGLVDTDYSAIVTGSES